MLWFIRRSVVQHDLAKMYICGHSADCRPIIDASTLCWIGYFTDNAQVNDLDSSI